MKWELKRFDEKEMPADLDADIRKGLVAAFPADEAFFTNERGWHGSWPQYSFVAQAEDHLVGHVAVVERNVLIGDQSYTVGGIQNVFVLPTMKGSGLSGDLMRAAVAEMARRGYDFGLLFCITALEKVYAPMGWRHVGGRSVFRREDGGKLLLPEKNIPMYYPLELAALPPGDIDLNGNDW